MTRTSGTRLGRLSYLSAFSGRVNMSESEPDWRVRLALGVRFTHEYGYRGFGACRDGESSGSTDGGSMHNSQAPRYKLMSIELETIKLFPARSLYVLCSLIHYGNVLHLIERSPS